MLIALFVLASATEVPIHVGRFDPAEFPNAQRIERRMPHADMNQRIERILGSKTCELDGQNKLKFDLVVPYAVRMEPSGAPNKVVVKEIGCPQIERLVGEIALELAKAGDFKIGHEAGDRWYVSEAYFTRLSEELARRQEDDDKVICKKDRPKINSRIATVKVCRTVAEWRQYDRDRSQLQRDMNGQDPMSASN